MNLCPCQQPASCLFITSVSKETVCIMIQPRILLQVKGDFINNTQQKNGYYLGLLPAVLIYVIINLAL